MNNIPDKILVVDDEDYILEMLSECLNMAGYTCQTVKSSRTATERLAKEAFDLVLTDLNMPDMDGIELLRHILNAYPNTAVVMITGLDSVWNAVEAMKLGAYDYLQKPVPPKELILRIQRALERRNLLQEKRNYHQNLEQEVLVRTTQLQNALQKIQQTYFEAQEALIVALGFKDTETRGHCRRVMEYASTLGKTMGLSETEIIHLERGALLHDIGKIGVPDRILHKPGSLTEEEWAIMRTHPVIGHQMIAEIEFLASAIPVVLSHHERYDGSGYPYQLAGDKIPLAARIFAIVDALDAITSIRPYKVAQPLSVAKQEIVCSAGAHFDPDIVNIFMNIPDESILEIQNRIK